MNCNWNCYVLVIRVTEPISVRLRGVVTTVEPGVYFYVGSSRKPCTVLARITRHLSKSKPVHWHVDQLTTTEKTKVTGALLVDLKTADCELALSKTMEVARLSYIRCFGSTDKPPSVSHLFKCQVDNHLECASLAYELVESIPGVNELVYVEV